MLLKKEIFGEFLGDDIIDVIINKIEPLAAPDGEISTENTTDFLNNIETELKKIFGKKSKKVMFYTSLISLFAFTNCNVKEKTYTRVDGVSRYDEYKNLMMQLADQLALTTATETYFRPDLPTPQSFINMISKQKFLWLEKLNEYGFSDQHLIYLFKKLIEEKTIFSMGITEIITTHKLSNIRIAERNRRLRRTNKRFLGKKGKKTLANAPVIEQPPIFDGPAKNQQQNFEKMKKNHKKDISNLYLDDEDFNNSKDSINL